MRRVFLSKYQEYYRTWDMQGESFTIIQDDDEMLQDYLERFLYILQRSKLRLDPNTIITLFLRGLTDNARNNLKLLGQGVISQQNFDQICELCQKFSRNQYRSGRGTRNKNRKTKSTNAMIVGLENKMENMKIDIMNIVNKQLDSLTFQQKLMREQESLCIFCPKCRDKHPPKECPLNLKENNKCAICAEDHTKEKCPSIPRLKAVFTGGQPQAEQLYATGARRHWPQVGAGMAPEFPPHYFGYNPHAYSYPNFHQQWQYGNQYQHGQPPPTMATRLERPNSFSIFLQATYATIPIYT